MTLGLAGFAGSSGGVALGGEISVLRSPESLTVLGFRARKA